MLLLAACIFLSTLSLRRATAAKRTTDIRPLFLSTLSLRRATSAGWNAVRPAHFYPRSPCGERLLGNVVAESRTWNFYPRSPCGERHGGPIVQFDVSAFLSTLSLRRATASHLSKFNTSQISIHALLAESDHHLSTYRHQGQQFLSTLSLRRATQYFFRNF